jgi:hypothetical protein
MNRKQFVLVILFVLINIWNQAVHATDFYQNCLLPNSIGGNIEAITLAPLDSNCQRVCQKECEAFSRTFNPYVLLDPNSSDAQNVSQELNADVITECYSQCQRGVDDVKCNAAEEKKAVAVGGQFKSRYFQAFQASCADEKTEDIFYKVCVKKDGSTYTPAGGCTDSLACNPMANPGYISFYKTLQPEVGVGKMCSSDQDNAYNAVSTTYTAKANDKFTFNLTGGAAQNQLFLCGKKHLNVVPIFQRADITNGDDWFTFNWKNKNSHRYLATLSRDSKESP